jgi:hypothetical protein
MPGSVHYLSCLSSHLLKPVMFRVRDDVRKVGAVEKDEFRVHEAICFQ